MRVKLFEVTEEEFIDAHIREARTKELPSLQENWRFNFASQLRKRSHAKAYVLVTDETASIIEGCMIFQWLEGIMPYMAYLEIAPHNRGVDKKYDYVAGCLIAFAVKQAYAAIDDNYKGYLLFDVQEEDEEDAKRLMRNYSSKYYAQRIGNSTQMIITPEEGEKLMKEYLSYE